MVRTSSRSRNDTCSRDVQGFDSALWVAAVVAKSEGAAEEGCRKIEIDYELLPAVFDPEEAMSKGAPVIHDKGAESRIRRPGQNILLEIHGNVGGVEAGFKAADVIHEATYTTHRVRSAERTDVMSG